MIPSLRVHPPLIITASFRAAVAAGGVDIDWRSWFEERINARDNESGAATPTNLISVVAQRRQIDLVWHYRVFLDSVRHSRLVLDNRPRFRPELLESAQVSALPVNDG